jgi:hypothetical protein
MEAAVAVSTHKRIPAPLVTAVLAVVAWASHIAVREATSIPPGAPLRLAVTAALVLAFAVHVITTVRAMRHFDEFTRTVHLTALAFAFPATMIAMFAIGFFRAEGLLAEMDPRDLVALMVMTYGAGLTWAWRRY